MIETIKKIISEWFTPGMFIIVLLGVNSITESATLLSFNIGARVIEIPIPALGETVGWVLVSMPVISILPSVFRKLSKTGVEELPTEEKIEVKKKGRFSKLWDLLLYLPIPHK